MPHQKNKAPQLKHMTSQNTPPLTLKDDDRLEGSWTTQKTELEKGPKGDPRVKEGWDSIALKDKEK
jgi:hypothetical protein